jgi:hypothetical protein
MTGFAPVLWSIWGAFILLFAIVKLYISRLARDEEDQIFLGEGFTQEKSAQADIVAKINKAQPFQKAALGLVIAMTAVVVVYYVFDIFRQFQ